MSLALGPCDVIHRQVIPEVHARYGNTLNGIKTRACRLYCLQWLRSLFPDEQTSVKYEPDKGIGMHVKLRVPIEHEGWEYDEFSTYYDVVPRNR